MCVCNGMNPAETADPVKMPFGIWAQAGPRNHVLHGRPDPPGEGAILRVGEYGHAPGPYRSRCHFACGLEWSQVTIC